MPGHVRYENKFDHEPSKAILRAIRQFETAFRGASLGSIHVCPDDFDEIEADGLPVVVDGKVAEGQVVVYATET
jgi:hypothetical protein